MGCGTSSVGHSTLKDVTSSDISHENSNNNVKLSSEKDKNLVEKDKNLLEKIKEKEIIAKLQHNNDETIKKNEAQDDKGIDENRQAAIKLIQKTFRGMVGRNRAKKEKLWHVWNTLEYKEEKGSFNAMLQIMSII